MNTCPRIYRYRKENNRPEASFRDVLFFRGKTVDSQTGLLAEGTDSDAVNIEPIPAAAGDVLRWKDPDIRCVLFYYDPCIDERWVQTYCYEPESNWTMYDRERSGGSLTAPETVFSGTVYIRLVMHIPEGKDLPKDLRTLFEFVPGKDRRKGTEEQASYLRKEIQRIRKKLEAVRKPEDTVLFLLADTHYTVNGGWEETERSLKAAAAVCTPDAVVHLGDLTDGLLPKEQTLQYAGRVLQGMREAAEPVFCCLGNHDSNYFRNNPERMSAKETAQQYLGRDREYYFADLPGKKLRMIFLSSFDSRKKEPGKKYGFSLKERIWLRRILNGTPERYRVIVFSHVPLLPEMHVWSRDIRGSKELLSLLEAFQAERHALLAFVHGHNHADQTEKDHTFPIISVGCSKLESFPEKKPVGAVCYKRERDTVTQELWDVMRIRADGTGLDLFRFGAGRDRHLRTDLSAEKD